MPCTTRRCTPLLPAIIRSSMCRTFLWIMALLLLLLLLLPHELSCMTLLLLLLFNAILRFISFPETCLVSSFRCSYLYLHIHIYIHAYSYIFYKQLQIVYIYIYILYNLLWVWVLFAGVLKWTVFNVWIEWMCSGLFVYLTLDNKTFPTCEQISLEYSNASY